MLDTFIYEKVVVELDVVGDAVEVFLVLVVVVVVVDVEVLIEVVVDVLIEVVVDVLVDVIVETSEQLQITSRYLFTPGHESPLLFSKLTLNY